MELGWCARCAGSAGSVRDGRAGDGLEVSRGANITALARAPNGVGERRVCRDWSEKKVRRRKAVCPGNLQVKREKESTSANAAARGARDVDSAILKRSW